MYENLENESGIILKVQEGDREAFTELVLFYQTKLRSVLSFFCSSPDMVEEFVQDSFVQAYVSIKSFDPQQPFFPWLKTIAMNKLRKAARYRAVRLKKADDYLYHLQMSRAEDDPNGELAEANGLALKNCLAKLDPAQAELLKERYMHEKSLDELAETYGKKIGALKVQIHRLRLILKDCIELQLTH